VERQRFIKDPDTGKHVSRLNPRDEWVVQDVPVLQRSSVYRVGDIARRVTRSRSRTVHHVHHLCQNAVWRASVSRRWSDGLLNRLRGSRFRVLNLASGAPDVMRKIGGNKPEGLRRIWHDLAHAMRIPRDHSESAGTPKTLMKTIIRKQRMTSKGQNPLPKPTTRVRFPSPAPPKKCPTRRHG
jgi:hypothetical protein